MSTTTFSTYPDPSAVLASTSGQMARAVLEMLGAARQALDTDPRQARDLVDRATVLLQPLGRASAAEGAIRGSGGLAPWQVRKVTRHVTENLDGRIDNGELAALVRLSVGHFGRAFKQALGLSPREFITQTRIDHAKVLMSRPGLSLSQIALDCGFCDQAHLSRTFHQIVGTTPNSWRRANMLEMAA